MKKHSINALVICAMAASMLTACFDDSYDLSDIDTTSELKVNDLVIPVNIDDIKMSSIIDIVDNGIVQIVNGEYCIVKENNFYSDPINIGSVELNCMPISSSLQTISLPAISGTFPAAGISLDLSTSPSDFNIVSGDVPSFIKSIEEFSGNLRFTITISLDGFGSNLKSFSLKNVKIQLPKGLKEVSGNGEYTASTGIFALNDTKVSGTKIDVAINVGRINFNDSHLVFDTEGRKVTFDGQLGITNATAVITAADLKSATSLPTSVTYLTEYLIDDINVETFTGEFEYPIENLEIPGIDFEELPDVLSQEGTDVVVVNPQFYMTLNNPLSSYDIEGQLSFNIRALRSGEPDKTFPMNTVVKASSAPVSYYCISPLKPESYHPGYQDASWWNYADLGMVLSGNRMPDVLDIYAVNPLLNKQRVVNFPLNQTVEPVTGQYLFYVPLQFAGGSTVIYTSDIDGWGSDDLDKLTIETLTVTANVTSDIPVELDFTAFPIDREGKQIGNVEIVGGKVPANAKDYPLTVKITGKIRDLDGIRYRAVASTDDDTEALTENMNILLKKIRAQVSGSYLTDF